MKWLQRILIAQKCLMTLSLPWNYAALHWVDYTTGKQVDMDIYFDRLVAVTIDDIDRTGKGYIPDHTSVTVGIFIDETHVLTSYNAFRNLTRYKSMRQKLVITILIGRTFQDFKSVTYNCMYLEIICARQVVPVADEDITDDEWHGLDHMHSPIHDLMVIRTNESVTFLDPNPDLYSFDKYSKTGSSHLTAGPFKTEIAAPDMYLGREIKFASLGFKTDSHIHASYFIHSKTYEPEDNVIVDCEEWMPRDWGLFICILNVDNYVGVGQGAMLIYNYTVFGVGSFSLRKGNWSILVFTDVREYYDLIFETCTADDYM